MHRFQARFAGTVWAVIAFLCTLALSACAQMQSMQNLLPGTAYVDPNDVCAGDKRALLNAKKGYAESIMGAVGVSVEDTLRRIVDDTVDGFGRGQPFSYSTRNIDEQLVLAVHQGVRNGYFKAKQQQYADSTRLTASIYKDIRADNTEIDRATNAFTQLKDCRFAAARRIKKDFAAGRMSRKAAAGELKDLQRRFDDDVKVAGELGVEMRDRGKQFKYASTELLKSDPAARKRYNKQKKRKKRKQRKKQGTDKRPPKKTSSKPDAAGVANVTDTNVQKAKAFNKDVKGSKVAAKDAFSMEGTISLMVPGATIREA